MVIKGHRRSWKVIECHERSRKVKQGHGRVGGGGGWPAGL